METLPGKVWKEDVLLLLTAAWKSSPRKVGWGVTRLLCFFRIKQRVKRSKYNDMLRSDRFQWFNLLKVLASNICYFHPEKGWEDDLIDEFLRWMVQPTND